MFSKNRILGMHTMSADDVLCSATSTYPSRRIENGPTANRRRDVVLAASLACYPWPAAFNEAVPQSLTPRSPPTWASRIPRLGAASLMPKVVRRGETEVHRRGHEKIQGTVLSNALSTSTGALSVSKSFGRLTRGLA